MTSIVILMVGVLLIYLGVADQFNDAIANVNPAPGYEQISLSRYLLGGAVVLVPAYFLEKQNNRAAWQYVFLITLSILVYFYDDVERFTGFISSEVSK